MRDADKLRVVDRDFDTWLVLGLAVGDKDPDPEGVGADDTLASLVTLTLLLSDRLGAAVADRDCESDGVGDMDEEEEGKGTGEHATAPGALPSPAPHALQVAWPSSALNRPATHGSHRVALGADAFVPGAHGVHTAAPSVAAYVPAVQSTQYSLG